MLAAPHLVQVRSTGEHVVLAFGNWRHELHYETAILLAYWMQRRARDAKRASGRMDRKLYGIGTLHDASAPPRDVFTPGKVFSVRRDVLKLAQIEVNVRGADVLLKFGHTEIGIPWSAALIIAQWIRLKAKEAKTRASDTARHWSKITIEHMMRHGETR